MRDEKSFQTRNETAGILEVFQGCVTQAGAIYRPQMIHDVVDGAIHITKVHAPKSLIAADFMTIGQSGCIFFVHFICYDTCEVRDVIHSVKGKRHPLLRKLWKQRAFFLMLLPGLAYYVIYKYAPIVLGVATSVVKYNLRKGLAGSKLLNPWYSNFKFFFESNYFSQLLSNTLIISLSKILLTIPIALLLAILLYECRSVKLRRCVQTLTYMPHFLSWIVIYGMCFSLLSETNGMVNVLIRKLTGHTVPFFTDAHIFRGVIIWSDVWKSVGWQSIIYMAAIAGVDPNLYDAAHIDGSGRLKSIWYITLPSIMPVVITTLVLKCGNVLDAGFDQIFVMYNTAVRSTVDIIDTWVYRTGLEQWNISLSSAVGLFKSVISMILVILVNQLAKKWEASVW